VLAKGLKFRPKICNKADDELGEFDAVLTLVTGISSFAGVG